MATEKIDHTHPLFLQASDTTSLIFIPIQLTGSKNYRLWSRSMRLALKAKRKLGFVIRACATNSFEKNLHEEWETFWEDLQEQFDKVNRVRVFQLHRAISRLSQGSDSVAVYFTKLKELWAEYDVSACRQILMKTTKRTLNQPYALIIQDESQQCSGGGVMGQKADPLAMQAGRGQGFRGRKQHLQYEHCRMRGHTKENCYKIIGYPEDFKGRKGFQPKRVLTAENHVEGSVTQSSQGASQSKGDYFFTEYQQILGLLSKDSPLSDTQADNQPTVAGIISALSSSVHVSNKKNDDWIIDSGATHHISSALDLMSDVRRVDDKAQDQVTLPNGVSTKKSHIGSSYLSVVDKLQNVLHIPDFKFNLMSVSKLTRDLRYTATFLPELCVFQELYNGRVNEIGKEDKGLYVLKGKGVRLLAAHVDVKGSIDSNMQNKCSVCPLAKQSRLSFCDSEKRSTTSFELVHMDIWGTYKKSTHDRKHYFLTFVDDFSRATWIFLIQFKNKTIIFLKQFSEFTGLLFGLNLFAGLSYWALLDFVSLELQVSTGTFPEVHSPEGPSQTPDPAEVINTNLLVLEPPAIHDALNTAKDMSIDGPIQGVQDVPVDDAQNVQGVPLAESSSNAPTRQSLRVKTPHIWQRDYVLKEPHNLKEAVKDERWITAMKQEVQELEENNTWEVVDLPPGKTPIGSKWLCSCVSGFLGSCFVAQICENTGIFCCFAAAVTAEIYSFYLHFQEASRQWNLKLTEALVGEDKAKAALYQQFKLKDLGELRYFLGIEVLRSKHGILLNQRKYTLELISKLGLSGAKPALTPLEVNQKLTTVEYDKAAGVENADPLADANSYKK
ncbi:uncharacterized protein LOC142162386 [Nicotiana tabacum]|uniref:Uncharacterized protein LOC142162386 n=1 Tax=Nicotiana tabacum TaxID=4097 RepID=A0AC58RQ31_TOBAC